MRLMTKQYSPRDLREACAMSREDAVWIMEHCAEAWEADRGMWKDAERQVDRLQAVDGLSGTVHVYRATVLELTKRLEAARRAWREGNYPGLEAALAAGEET